MWIFTLQFFDVHIPSFPVRGDMGIEKHLPVSFFIISVTLTTERVEAPALLERHKIEDVITKSSDSDESKTATFQLVHSNFRIPVVDYPPTIITCESKVIPAPPSTATASTSANLTSTSEITTTTIRGTRSRSSSQQRSSPPPLETASSSAEDDKQEVLLG